MERQDSDRHFIMIILNLSLITMIVLSAIIYAGVFYDVMYDKDYMLIVAYTMVLFSDPAYIGIILGYFILAKSFPVTLSNKALGVATLVFQTLPSVKILFEPFTGPISDFSAAWAGLIVSALLLAWGIVETVKLIKTYQGHQHFKEATH